MYCSEQNLKAQSTSTLHYFLTIREYLTNFNGCAMLVGTSSKRTREFCLFPFGLSHRDFTLIVFTLLHTHVGSIF